jgi:hypothetical protein
MLTDSITSITSITSIPAAIAIYSLAKARLVTLYLIIAAVGSMASGYLFLLYLA